ncbi:MAG: toprim domain-containing protein, partial [Ruminococcus sp.]|nr:toprim domain-containing protein [Ruminococcus sp.]
MKITEEQIERANSVNLPSFLMANGFELKRVGREYSWKEHDSLHIKNNEPGERGRWFRFSTDEGGDNISFVREYMGKSFVEAVEMLNGESYERDFVPFHNYEHKPKEVKKADIAILENTDSKRVFAYLCKTRGLDYNMISKLVKSGKIVQEQKTGNAVFKIFDENNRLVGAEKVGTSTQQKFKGIATGSASGYGFEVCKGNGENALFFESAIDMLSYLQMYGSQLENHRLVSMMGVKPSVVIDTMERFGIPPENVFICSDNDKAGNELFTRLQNEFPQIKRIFPDNRYKDWNDALRDIPKEKEEVGKVTTYGNKTWNDATDNRNKTLVSMNENTFMKLKNHLDNSGINYYAYAKKESVVMAVNDKDIDWLKQLVGNENLPTRKSNVEYIPSQKNIIGNAEYRYISDKQYISADSDTALKMAEIMLSRNVQFSGRIYPNGKATLTVSGADLAHVKSIQQSVIDMRKQFARES